jgi:hypothetical protein
MKRDDVTAAALEGASLAPAVRREVIWCCACASDVAARLTTGSETYPHRPDLARVPRWKCDACGNHVGTHIKTDQPTRPLGNIPSPEIKRARIKIHELIDPVWKSGAIKRGHLYARMSKALGYEYHTGEIKTIEDARHVYRTAASILASLRDEVAAEGSTNPECATPKSSEAGE